MYRLKHYIECEIVEYNNKNLSLEVSQLCNQKDDMIFGHFPASNKI